MIFGLDGFSFAIGVFVGFMFSMLIARFMFGG